MYPMLLDGKEILNETMKVIIDKLERLKFSRILDRETQIIKKQELEVIG